jgi:hypothetical protein
MNPPLEVRTAEFNGARRGRQRRREETKDDRGRRTDDGGQRTEDGGRRTEGGRRRTEDGRRTKKGNRSLCSAWWAISYRISPRAGINLRATQYRAMDGCAGWKAAPTSCMCQPDKHDMYFKARKIANFMWDLQKTSS